MKIAYILSNVLLTLAGLLILSACASYHATYDYDPDYIFPL